MNENKKTLYFITESYEKNKMFYYNEIVELSKLYNIRFVSTTGIENGVCDIPNTELFFYSNKVSKLKKVKYAIQYIFDKRCHKEHKDIFLDKKKLLYRFFRSIEFYAYANEFYLWFMDNVYLGDEEALYYTYWCNYYTLGLALHYCNHSKLNFVTRLHGFDLYDNQNDSGRLPFRDIINNRVERLFFVSKLSREYYLKKYSSSLESKLILNRLGTKGLINYYLDNKSDEFVLVSCSNVIPLKRVDYIIDALSAVDFPVKWIHFGDGMQYDLIKAQAEQKLQKNNISYELRGRVANNEILDFYSNNKMDAFINVSFSEGCPMSIMEAMSVGTPIIATDVGEARILTDGNGILLDSNPLISDITMAIEKIYKLKMYDTEVYNNMRSESTKKWKALFNVDNNIKDFIQELQKL